MPQHLHAKATPMPHDIWMAATLAQAVNAFDLFVSSFGVKDPEAVACLEKDRDVLLRFYDFPAEPWVHLRTTNPSSGGREHLRHGPPASGQDQGQRQSAGLSDHGVQAGAARRVELADAQRFTDPSGGPGRHPLRGRSQKVAA